MSEDVDRIVAVWVFSDYKTQQSDHAGGSKKSLPHSPDLWGEGGHAHFLSR